METIIEEKIDMAPELLEQINIQEEKQVIVHAKVIKLCCYIRQIYRPFKILNLLHLKMKNTHVL